MPSRIGGEIFSLDIGEKGRLLLFLQLLAGFNMSLFLLNMLPVLPLDGGHILGAGIEWVRRGWARIRGRALPGPFDAARLMPLAYVVVLLFLGLSLHVSRRHRQSGQPALNRVTNGGRPNSRTTLETVASRQC